MSIYVIGDVQGCFDELQLLLEKIRFNEDKDRLWFTGDLVNRGPKSLETLRFVKSLGSKAIVVLGNHDIHLLVCYFDKNHDAGNPSFQRIFSATDCEPLMEWLSGQKLMHYENGYCMVHAGLAPDWDLALAQECARSCEAKLQERKKERKFFANLYGDKPSKWSETFDEEGRDRFIINAFTRMRYCTLDGDIDTGSKDKPGSQGSNLVPWFDYPARKNRDLEIVFGHWSSLGLLSWNGVHCLDSGCVWGGQLTALEICGVKRQYFQVDCIGRGRKE